MDKIIYRLVFNRKKELNKKGMALVQIEAYQNRKKKYFSTKVYLYPNQWDSKKCLVKNHPNASALNHMIYAYMAEIEEKELKLWQHGHTPSLTALREVLSESKEEITSFLSFYKKEVALSSLKDSTKSNHLTTYDLLKSYKSDVSFKELTFEFVSTFEYFLKSKDYHVNTIAKHMKHLKRYVNIAINKEHIDIQQYAFRKYKIRSVESKHTHLAPEELTGLENLVLDKKYAKLEHTLDAFLFCCYVGIRYSDFINLNADNLVQMENKTWLVYKSVKTSIEVRLPVYLLFSGKGMKILKKYKKDMSSFFQLRTNSNVNKELLVITKLAGISKRVSFHTARHTNATLLIYSGVNITTVQKLLGHKSVKTTQVYTNIMDMTIVKDLTAHTMSK